MARILYASNLPTPYRLPLYRAIDAALRSAGHEFRVFFLGYAKSDRAWRIEPAEVTGFAHASGSGSEGVIGAFRDLVRDVRGFSPDVVVLAWAMDHVALAALLWLRLRGVRCIVVSGETVATARANPYALLRRIFREPFFRLAARFITYGVRSTEYLRTCGVPEARITTGINVVDTAYFMQAVDDARTSGAAVRERANVARQDGETFACHLLFVGYLHCEKGMAETLKMMALLNREDTALHVVGAGPDEAMLRAEAERAGLAGRVFFHGYRQIDDLPVFYAMADVLLFPSVNEVFGLVMVEGAAAGLPIIASVHAGGVPDIVADGVNGLVVDPRDTHAFAAAVARLVDDPRLRTRMAAASRAHAERCLTLERSAEQYVRGILNDEC